MNPKVPSTPCVSIVMPVYNEAATVGAVIAIVLAQPCVAELICVNDCSTDGSGTVLDTLAAADPRIRAFHHPLNQGKGPPHAYPSLSGHFTAFPLNPF